VVPTLVALNVAVFAWTVLQARSLMDNSDAALFRAWAGARRGGGRRVVAAVHGGFRTSALHIAFNMWALWVLGRDLELVLGRARFLALYLVSLLGGSAAVVLFADPNQYVAGASGAVFGADERPRCWCSYGCGGPTGRLALIVLNLVISQVVPGISIAGHVGGLVVGAVASAALVFAPARQRTVIQVGALVALTALLLPRSRCTSSDSRPDPTAARPPEGRDVLGVGVQVEPAEDVEALGAVGGDRVELQQRLATQPAHAQHPHTLHERPRVVAVAHIPPTVTPSASARSRAAREPKSAASPAPTVAAAAISRPPDRLAGATPRPSSPRPRP
jgi:membrane associated rhomboid family serine protease